MLDRLSDGAGTTTIMVHQCLHKAARTVGLEAFQIVDRPTEEYRGLDAQCRRECGSGQRHFNHGEVPVVTLAAVGAEMGA